MRDQFDISGVFEATKFEIAQSIKRKKKERVLKISNVIDAFTIYIHLFL